MRSPLEISEVHEVAHASQIRQEKRGEIKGHLVDGLGGKEAAFSKSSKENQSLSLLLDSFFSVNHDLRSKWSRSCTLLEDSIITLVHFLEFSVDYCITFIILHKLRNNLSNAKLRKIPQNSISPFSSKVWQFVIRCYHHHQSKSVYFPWHSLK